MVVGGSKVGGGPEKDRLKSYAEYRVGRTYETRAYYRDRPIVYYGRHLEEGTGVQLPSPNNNLRFSQNAYRFGHHE